MSVTLPIYNLEGKKVSDFSFTPFEEKLSDKTLAQVMRVYITNQHQGTKKAKTRGEIDKPDTKPWKQKGTGRARHGSKNSPIWVGGGATFGPRPHTRRLDLPLTIRRKAMRYLIDQEVKQGSVVILADKTESTKTKDAVAFLTEVNSFRRPVSLVLVERDEKTSNLFRNVEKVLIRRSTLMSPLDFNKKNLFVFTESSINELIERVK